jgi:hypothetical protein
MAGQRFFLVARDLAVRKAGEIIVPLVVFARMIDAEHEVLPFGITTHRGTVGPVCSHPSHWHSGVVGSAGRSPLRRTLMRSKYLESSFMTSIMVLYTFGNKD